MKEKRYLHNRAKVLLQGIIVLYFDECTLFILIKITFIEKKIKNIRTYKIDESISRVFRGWRGILVMFGLLLDSTFSFDVWIFRKGRRTILLPNHINS